jgi:hypothetical protein
MPKITASLLKKQVYSYIKLIKSLRSVESQFCKGWDRRYLGVGEPNFEAALPPLIPPLLHEL